MLTKKITLKLSKISYAYLRYNYGEAFCIDKSTYLGKYILNCFERKNGKQVDFNFDHELVVLVNKKCIKSNTALSAIQMREINNFIKTQVYELFYIYMDTFLASTDKEIKEGIEKFINKYDLDFDMYESLKKSYYRYRKGK